MTATTSTVVSAHNCSRYDEDCAIAGLAKAIKPELKQAILIETTYQGPTDTKGSRIRAKMLGTSYAHTIGLDYSLGTVEARLKAALSMLGNWFEGEALVAASYDETKHGFIFVFNHY